MTTQLVDWKSVHICWMKCSVSIALPAINFVHHTPISSGKNFALLTTRSATFHLILQQRHLTSVTKRSMKFFCVQIKKTMSHNHHLHLRAFV